MTKSRKNLIKSGSRARKSAKLNTGKREAKPSSTTKTAALLQLLSKPEGVTVAVMANAVGWQNNSVRGFLAGQASKLGLKVSSEKGPDGVRRYRAVQN